MSDAMKWTPEDVRELKKQFATVIKNIQNLDHIAVVTIDDTGFLNTINASSDSSSGHSLVGGLEALKFKMLKDFYDDDEIIDLNLDE